jgi:hypothetical protein
MATLCAVDDHLRQLLLDSRYLKLILLDLLSLRRQVARAELAAHVPRTRAVSSKSPPDPAKAATPGDCCVASRSARRRYGSTRHAYARQPESDVPRNVPGRKRERGASS